MVETSLVAGTRSALASRERIQAHCVRLLAASLLLAAGACGPPEPDESDYLTRLVEDREYKDDFFKNSPDSPVPLDRRSWMVPLHYFEPDLSYRVPANLAIGEEQPVFDIPTSTGLMRKMRHVGHLEFVLHGETYRLAALLSEGEGLFVPFRDETSREETYPAGRYLDLPFSPTGVYDLDFNRAYHPTCYFDEEFDCPFPPPQNRLPTPVRAGERLPPPEERRMPLTGLDRLDGAGAFDQPGDAGAAAAAGRPEETPLREADASREPSGDAVAGGPEAGADRTPTAITSGAAGRP